MREGEGDGELQNKPSVAGRQKIRSPSPRPKRNCSFTPSRGTRDVILLFRSRARSDDKFRISQALVVARLPKTNYRGRHPYLHPPARGASCAAVEPVDGTKTVAFRTSAGMTCDDRDKSVGVTVAAPRGRLAPRAYQGAGFHSFRTSSPCRVYLAARNSGERGARRVGSRGGGCWWGGGGRRDYTTVAVVVGARRMAPL